MAFTLLVLASPADIAGDYTLTFIADGACAGLSDRARERTYPATIAPSSDPNGFSITLSQPPFLQYYKTLYIGVAGDYVAIYFGGDGVALVEELAPNTYLAVEGGQAFPSGHHPFLRSPLLSKARLSTAN